MEIIIGIQVCLLYLNEDNVLIVPNHEKNKDYYENPSLKYSRDLTLSLRKMVERVSFSAKPKQKVVYPIEEHVLWCLIIKGREIITRIQFVLFDR